MELRPDQSVDCHNTMPLRTVLSGLAGRWARGQDSHGMRCARAAGWRRMRRRPRTSVFERLGASCRRKRCKERGGPARAAAGGRGPRRQRVRPRRTVDPGSRLSQHRTHHAPARIIIIHDVAPADPPEVEVSGTVVTVVATTTRIDTRAASCGQAVP